MSDSEVDRQAADKSAAEASQPIAELARQIVLAMEEQRGSSKSGPSGASTSKGELVSIALVGNLNPTSPLLHGV